MPERSIAFSYWCFFLDIKNTKSAVVSVLLRAGQNHCSLFKGQVQNSIQSFITVFLVLGAGQT